MFIIVSIFVTCLLIPFQIKPQPNYSLCCGNFLFSMTTNKKMLRFRSEPDSDEVIPRLFIGA